MDFQFSVLGVLGLLMSSVSYYYMTAIINSLKYDIPMFSSRFLGVWGLLIISVSYYCITTIINSYDIPVFSSRVLGVLGLLMISVSWFNTCGIYSLISAPVKERNKYPTSYQIRNVMKSSKMNL